jgi:NAD(P)-dependent dehydrogenase (short-subunit alcohol dehydrogenase family)
MNILVTGSSRGIGKAIAQELEGLGEIFITSRDEEALKALSCTRYSVCDLSSEPRILAEFIVENMIDVLVNNAGEYVNGAIETMTPGQINQIYSTNLIAPAFLISYAVPYMKKRNWGRIINIGSISGVMGEANASLYSSTKAGLIGLTKALALELAPNNITVNTINPGFVQTSMSDGADIGLQPRLLEPVEVAKLVKYLISDDARGITGQSINLCAGLSLGF